MNLHRRLTHGVVTRLIQTRRHKKLTTPRVIAGIVVVGAVSNNLHRRQGPSYAVAVTHHRNGSLHALHKHLNQGVVRIGETLHHRRTQRVDVVGIRNPQRRAALERLNHQRQTQVRNHQIQQLIGTQLVEERLRQSQRIRRGHTRRTHPSLSGGLVAGALTAIRVRAHKRHLQGQQDVLQTAILTRGAVHQWPHHIRVVVAQRRQHRGVRAESINFVAGLAQRPSYAVSRAQRNLALVVEAAGDDGHTQLLCHERPFYTAKNLNRGKQGPGVR